MPWESATVSEQRENFIRDYLRGYYTRTELAQKFSISRKTACKWIRRFRRKGPEGLQEQSRRPRSCPWQTKGEIRQELISMRKARPTRGPRKLLEGLKKRHRGVALPAVSESGRQAASYWDVSGGRSNNRVRRCC
jgi:transposase